MLRNDYIQRATAFGLVRLRLQGDGNLRLALYSQNGSDQLKVCKGLATNPSGMVAI